MSATIWLFVVKKKGMFDPFLFIDDEKYLETLRLWRERNLKKFLEENYIPKGYRHLKCCSYKRPLRQ